MEASAARWGLVVRHPHIPQHSHSQRWGMWAPITSLHTRKHNCTSHTWKYVQYVQDFSKSCLLMTAFPVLFLCKDYLALFVYMLYYQNQTSLCEEQVVSGQSPALDTCHGNLFQPFPAQTLTLVTLPALPFTFTQWLGYFRSLFHFSCSDQSRMFQHFIFTVLLPAQVTMVGEVFMKTPPTGTRASCRKLLQWFPPDVINRILLSRITQLVLKVFF